jgi:hypothetical protein
LIVTARFIVVRSGTSECGFFSVGMVTGTAEQRRAVSRSAADDSMDD